MKIEVDYKFSQSIFLKNDPEQKEYLLSRIILCPKGVIMLEIFGGDDEFIEVPETFVTKGRDQSKILGIETEAED